LAGEEEKGNAQNVNLYRTTGSRGRGC